MLIRKETKLYIPMIRNYDFFDVPGYNGFNPSIIGDYTKANAGVTLDDSVAPVYDFDGSSFMHFGNSIGNFVDDFKIFCAFKTGSNVTTRQTLISKRAIAANRVGFEIFIDAGILKFVVLQSNSIVSFVVGTVAHSLALNTWYEFRFEFFKNTSAVIWLLDSTGEVGSGTAVFTLSFTMDNIFNFTLGRVSDFASTFLIGKIGFVAMFGHSDSVDMSDFNSSFYNLALMSHLGLR